jgi:cytochrome P450
MENLCDRLLDGIEAGEPVDWVLAVAMRLPIYTACHMLGIPGDHVRQIRSWSDAVEIASNPQSPEEMAEAMAKFASLSEFIEDQFKAKRGCPQNDLLTHLIATEKSQENITWAELDRHGQVGRNRGGYEL